MRAPKFLIFLLPLLSCKASVNADVNLSGKAQEQDDDDFSESVLEAPSPPPDLHTDYFGVARRLTLRSSARTAVCRCVAAVVGDGNNPEFDWHGDKPSVGSDALVVAVTSEGIDCEHQGRGPSIAAIDRQGQDVVVVLEEFKDTRPIALGAIIPNPGPGGFVYLRSRGNAPYGRPENTSQTNTLCRIGEGTP